MFRQSPSTELVLIKELPKNICTLHVKGPNAQKVRVFVLQNIHLAIFGQLMTTAGWGPSHTVERGLCRVTWVSKLFVVGHLLSLHSQLQLHFLRVAELVDEVNVSRTLAITRLPTCQAYSGADGAHAL